MNKEKIRKVLEDIIGVKNCQVDFVTDEQFGDYSSNVAMTTFGNNKLQTSKTKFKTPREYAEEIVDKLLRDKAIKKNFDKVEIAGPGFINFWLKKDILIDNLIQIDSEKEKYGSNNLLKGKKLMFEFAHPNTHKAFHIGHLRNITTGETLSRLHEMSGAKVIRVNYQGDVGLHIAKALWGIKNIGFSDPKDVRKRAEFLGKAYSTGATAYEKDEETKEEIHAINEKIYDKSDIELNKLYTETRKWSLDYFDEIYERVYSKFDRFYFESECAESGKKIALDALKKGILEKSEGAIIFRGSKYGLHDRVFVTGKGVPTYEGKDMGLAKLQFSEYNPDLLIHTVGPEQTDYFKVIFKALEFIMPEIKGRELHIPYGWVRLREGKMSSRSGNVILGEDILNEAKENIIKNYKTKGEIAEQVAVAAVKYSFLKTGLNQDIAFDLNESISLEGNSGPYLQYTYARSQSVLSKSKKSAKFKTPDTLEEEELVILRKLSQFQEIIIDATKNYSPNVLCTYLYDLASKFNTFYNKHKIIGSENEDFRILLTFGVGQVLKNGLNLLGIDSPERM